MQITDALERIVNRKSLKESEARSVMSQIMSGEVTPSQISALLVALRMKGETTAELTGFAREMRARVSRVYTSRKNVIDTCGTGGDSVKTFNISTTSAIIAASAGATVAKHGNRAVTSKCGSADVLEFLGVNLNLGTESVSMLLDEIGLAFLFAPNFHPAMKHAVGPRKEMKIRTVFNLLGPLTNPAGSERQMIGVYDPKLVSKFVMVLKRLGARRAVVAYGMMGVDEITAIGPTRIAIWDGKVLLEKIMNPEDFGVDAVDLNEILAGETIEDNARKMQKALSDDKSSEARAALPGAGVALWLGEVAKDIKEGVILARKAIKNGSAAAKLEELIRRSQTLA